MREGEVGRWEGEGGRSREVGGRGEGEMKGEIIKNGTWHIWLGSATKQLRVWWRTELCYSHTVQTSHMHIM